jgi:hypothetical protein
MKIYKIIKQYECTKYILKFYHFDLVACDHWFEIRKEKEQTVVFSGTDISEINSFIKGFTYNPDIKSLKEKII